MDAPSLSLSSPGGCSPKQERWKECLGMKDSLAQKVQAMHTRCQSVCWSLGNPKVPGSLVHLVCVS